jgi:hypothetical protein
MGGNMGTSTPYIEIIQPLPDPENWNYLYNENPMYVNGQRVTATLDGFAVPLSFALDRLRGGSATIDSIIGISGTSLGFNWVDVPDRFGPGTAGKNGDGTIVGTVNIGIGHWEPTWTNSWSFGIAIVPPPPSPPPVQLETKPKKKKPVKKKSIGITPQQVTNALAECIASFWSVVAGLNSIVATLKGSPGEASLTYIDGDGIIRTNTVVNSLKYTGSQLRYISDSILAGQFLPKMTGSVNGITITNGPLTVSGQTFYFSPLENYTASNRDKQNGNFPVLATEIGSFFSTQIHELGNSIAYLTGVEIGDPTGNNPTKDPDSGYQLQKCVADKLTGGK